jgi:hypothetical protein
MIKTTNHFFIQHQLTNGGLLLQDITTLQNIAQLCPFTDGVGVYQARTILSYYDSTDYFNVCEDNGSGNRYGEDMQEIVNNNTSSDFALYPNPNDGLFNINYVLTSDENAELVITDVTGKLVKAINLNQEANQMQIDLSHLQNGVYFYYVKQNATIIASDKIVIIK